MTLARSRARCRWRLRCPLKPLLVALPATAQILRSVMHHYPLHPRGEGLVQRLPVGEEDIEEQRAQPLPVLAPHMGFALTLEPHIVEPTRPGSLCSASPVGTGQGYAGRRPSRTTKNKFVLWCGLSWVLRVRGGGFPGKPGAGWDSRDGALSGGRTMPGSWNGPSSSRQTVSADKAPDGQGRLLRCTLYEILEEVRSPCPPSKSCSSPRKMSTPSI